MEVKIILDLAGPGEKILQELKLLFNVDRNFKEAKRLKEERDALHQDGIKGQEELESILKKIAEDKKLLEEYEQESNELDTQISEQDGVAGKVFHSRIMCLSL